MLWTDNAMRKKNSFEMFNLVSSGKKQFFIVERKKTYFNRIRERFRPYDMFMNYFVFSCRSRCEMLRPKKVRRIKI